MIRVDTVIGNLHDGYELPVQFEQDVLWLSRWDAQKRRLRKKSVGGRDLALALVRAGELRDGDVLALDRDAAVVARIEAGEVLVFTVDPTEPSRDPGHVGAETQSVSVRALRLGHVLGNQHWPMRIRQDGDHVEVVVPLTIDRRVVDAVVRSHRLEGVSYVFRAAGHDELELVGDASHVHADDHVYERLRHPGNEESTEMPIGGLSKGADLSDLTVTGLTHTHDGSTHSH